MGGQTGRLYIMVSVFLMVILLNLAGAEVEGSMNRDQEKVLKALEDIRNNVDNPEDGYLRKFVQPAQIKLLQRNQGFNVYKVHGVVGRTKCKFDNFVKKSKSYKVNKILRSLDKCRLDRDHGLLDCLVTINEDSTTGRLSSEEIECVVSQLKWDFDLTQPARQHRKVKRGAPQPDGLVHLYDDSMDPSVQKKELLGRDDGHDTRSHKRELLLGQDDHDRKPHDKQLLGQRDGHDQWWSQGGTKSTKKLLGQDGHGQYHHNNPAMLSKENLTEKEQKSSGKHEQPTNPSLGFRLNQDLADKVQKKTLKKMQSKASFKKFVKTFKKYYESKEEYQRRHKIFAKNMVKVLYLRATEQATGQYGWTPFADMTEDEFKAQRLGMKFPTPDGKLGGHLRDLPDADIPNVPLPAEFDWGDHGAVTPVKNQGSCGSCWAFSVTGNIEGLWQIQKGQLLSLSEQELVDCDKVDQGCNGGLPENAYKAIAEIGGLELESDYTYEGKDETCHFEKAKVKVTVSGGVQVSTNETEMAQWLVSKGPISVGLNANAMQFYRGGVSHPWKFLCSPSGIDHGVLITGFGVHEYPLFNKTYPFWTIKNSWGPGWGEKGYYRLYRGDGSCGINLMATSAVLDP